MELDIQSSLRAHTDKLSTNLDLRLNFYLYISILTSPNAMNFASTIFLSPPLTRNSQTLCNDMVSAFLDDHFIVYGAESTSNDGKQLVQILFSGGMENSMELTVKIML